MSSAEWELLSQTPCAAEVAMGGVMLQLLACTACPGQVFQPFSRKAFDLGLLS